LDTFWTLSDDSQKIRTFRHLEKPQNPENRAFVTDPFFEGLGLEVALAAHLKTEIFHRSFDLDRHEGF
jgi:hypothetical protein